MTKPSLSHCTDVLFSLFDFMEDNSTGPALELVRLARDDFFENPGPYLEEVAARMARVNRGDPSGAPTSSPFHESTLAGDLEYLHAHGRVRTGESIVTVFGDAVEKAMAWCKLACWSAEIRDDRLDLYRACLVYGLCLLLPPYL